MAARVRAEWESIDLDCCGGGRGKSANKGGSKVNPREREDRQHRESNLARLLWGQQYDSPRVDLEAGLGPDLAGRGPDLTQSPPRDTEVTADDRSRSNAVGSLDQGKTQGGFPGHAWARNQLFERLRGGASSAGYPAETLRSSGRYVEA